MFADIYRQLYKGHNLLCCSDALSNLRMLFLIAQIILSAVSTVKRNTKINCWAITIAACTWTEICGHVLHVHAYTHIDAFTSAV